MPPGLVQAGAECAYLAFLLQAAPCRFHLPPRTRAAELEWYRAFGRIASVFLQATIGGSACLLSRRPPNRVSDLVLSGVFVRSFNLPLPVPPASSRDNTVPLS